MSSKPYTPQADTVDLMNLFQQDVLEYPQVPSREVLLLRARLLFEEAMEFIEAAGCEIGIVSATDPLQSRGLPHEHLRVFKSNKEPNLKEMVDGLGDTLVVTYGAFNALGVKAKPVWHEVQRSNLSKAWPHCSVCDEVLESVIGEGATYFRHNNNTSHPRGEPWDLVRKIHKREDGKVVKSPDYSPANIEAVIENQSHEHKER